jgi:hypothetical protein
LDLVRQFLTPQVFKQARHAVPGERAVPPEHALARRAQRITDRVRGTD